MGSFPLFAAGVLLLFSGALRLAAQDLGDCTEDDFRFAAEGPSIVFPDDCSITLSNGPVTVASDLTIDGGGFDVTLNGSSNRLFTVLSGATLTLQGLTLQNGMNSNGGAIYIEEGAAVEITDCTFIENSAIGTNGDAGVPGASGSLYGTSGSRGGPGVGARGGAIYNLGDLTIRESRFFTNNATGGNGGDGGDGGSGSFQRGSGGSGGNGGSAIGGAIFNLGTMLVEDSTFEGNLATGGNGGKGGLLGGGQISGSPGKGGMGAMALGAGIYTEHNEPFVEGEEVDIRATIMNCTFSGNAAAGGSSGSGSKGFGGSAPHGADAFGGGVANAGGLAVTNSTFFQNNATGGNGGDGGRGGAGGRGIGGGLYNTGQVFTVHCTFANGAAIGGTNGAPDGGAFGNSGAFGKGLGGNIANLANKKLGLFFLQYTIIGTNFGGKGGYGTTIDGGFNLSMDSSVKLKKGSLKKRNPLLGPLADNGGPTKTMAIGTNSPAWDQIPFDLDETDVDQRGAERDDLRDIGAYEFQAALAPVISSLVTVPAGTNHLVTQTNGGTVRFTAFVLAAPPLTYQWYAITNGSSVSNRVRLTSSSSSSDTFVLTVASNTVGSYFVVVGNTAGTAQSDVIVVTNASGPVILNQPTNQVVTNGATATFAVTAAGDPPLTFFWKFNATNVASGTNLSSFTITNAQQANIGSYSVVVSNQLGAVTSDAATLNMLPFISAQPADQTVPENGTATFTVTAGGSQPFTYTWFRNGVQIPGASTPSYSKSSVTTNDSGNFHVSVANSFGTVDSRTATLTVTPAAPVAPGPPAFEIGAFGLGSGGLMLAFPTRTGSTYEVQYKDSLDAVAGWVPMLTNSGTGGWVTNDVPAGSASRFFRIWVR